MSGAGGRIGHCAKSSFKNHFRNRNSVVWMLIFPFLITSVSGFLLAGIDLSGGGEPVIYVQDLDDTNLSRRLVNHISEEYPIEILDPSENPRDYVEDNKYGAVFIIPEGFKDNWGLNSFTSGTYPIIVEMSSKQYLLEISVVKGDSTDNPTFIIPNYDTYTNIISEILGDTSNVYVMFFPSIVLLCITHVAINKVISEKIWMRKSNYNRILNNTNLRKHEWAISQISWMIVPGIICLVMSFAIISLFRDLLFSPMLFIVTVCTVAVSVPLGLLISSVVKSPENSALASSATILVMLQLSGGLIPLSAMPEIFNVIAYALPTRYILDGFSACLIGDISGAAASCVIILAFALIFTIGWIIVEKGASDKEAE